jgi:hypothetical protein
MFFLFFSTRTSLVLIFKHSNFIAPLLFSTGSNRCWLHRSTEHRILLLSECCNADHAGSTRGDDCAYINSLCLISTYRAAKHPVRHHPIPLNLTLTLSLLTLPLPLPYPTSLRPSPPHSTLFILILSELTTPHPPCFTSL